MSGRITRRAVLAKGLEGAGLALAAGAAGNAIPGLAAPALGKTGARPNILFVAIDDLNDWNGWLGGYPGVKTPNLDRLATIATGFRRAYTPAPACQAARAGILFGVEPHRSGVYTNSTGDWTESILRDKPSIVRWFKRADYETIGTGKIFHTGWRSGDTEANDASAWSSYYMPKHTESGREVLEWGASADATPQHEDVVRARWIVDTVLSKTHDKPFFAALGVRKPHMPWVVPREWFDKYPLNSIRYPLGALDTDHSRFETNADDKDLPQGGRAMVGQNLADHRKILAGKGWKSAIQAYLACASLADHAVGVALDGLLSGPNASNTIICVWSDHGWQLGEKLAWRKFTLWERATHVPLLIGGDGLRAGLSDALVSTIDLYPTLARLALGDAPDGLDGRSHHKYLRKADEAPRDHVLSTWSLDVGEGKEDDRDKHFAIRTESHRLIVYGDGDRELYDERSDPWEWNNLYDKPSKDDRALADRLAKHVPDKIAANVPKRDVEAVD